MAHRRERTIILASLFTALSAALGFLLAGIPNVELMTLTVFLSGVFCGVRLGAAVGALSILIHSLLNPLGPAAAPLLAAQVAGFAVIGGAGGIAAPRLAHPGARSALACASAGFALTLFYDVLTTLATAFIALGTAGFARGLRGIALAGVPFAAWHVGINTAVFAVGVVPIVRAARAADRGEGA
jgi:hypothetical protein